MRDKKMTLTQHLEELRHRLLHAAIGTAITTGIAFAIAPQIFRFLIRPTGGIKPVFIDITEMIGTYFKVSFFAGVAMALPLLLYELVMFVAPGLTPRERRFLLWFLPGAVVLFLAGAAFSYFVFLPPALKFLLHFGGDIATPQIRIGNYVSVVSRLLFFSGLSFETPLVLFSLAKIGVIHYRTLARLRPWAVVGAFVLGAVITPTFDPVNQTLVALPLIALFELSIWLARLVAPAESPETAEALR